MVTKLPFEVAKYYIKKNFHLKRVFQKIETKPEGKKWKLSYYWQQHIEQ